MFISGAELREWVHQISTNRSTNKNEENGRKVELIFHDVSTIFHINYWKCNKIFYAWGLKVTQAVKFIFWVLGLLKC